MEEQDNPFWGEAIKKFIYFVSFWESGQLSGEEDFKRAEEVFNKSVEDEDLTEEEQEGMEDKEAEEIAQEILSNKEEKPKPKAKRKTKKKEPVAENA